MKANQIELESDKVRKYIEFLHPGISKDLVQSALMQVEALLRIKAVASLKKTRSTLICLILSLSVSVQPLICTMPTATQG